MLAQMKLSNFKAWKEVDLRFGKVTGLFGANSSGKSSLLQFLLLLKQTKNATDRGLVLDFGGPSGLINLGTYYDVVHNHDEHTRMSWLLKWTLGYTLQINEPIMYLDAPPLKDSVLQTQCEVGLRRERLWPYELMYNFGGAKFKLESSTKLENKFKLETEGTDFKFKRNRGRAWPLSSPVKTYLFPDETRHYYQNANFLFRFEFQYEELMDSIYYLGPLREYPKREYHWAGSSPEDVGQRGERTIDAILAATRDGERRSLGYRRHSKAFQEMIAHWLNNLGLIREFDLEEIADGTNLYQAIVKTSRTSVPTALTDVGFGVSQVLPALVLLYYVPEGSTVLMEQPEIHLHPAVQSGLADVILNVAASRDVQIIVESHSEHFLRRLQRRVAEEKVPAKDVKLYFISNNRGRAQASDLALNEWGEIENWPNHFFGDEMKEIATIARESLRRKARRS